METRDRILLGAEELFFRFGIKSITMDDVAKHLGISKKTIYLYFNDKDAVVHQLMQRILEKDERIFSEIHKGAKTIIDEVFVIMKQMHTMFSTMNPIVFYDMQKYHPKTWKLFKDFKTNFILKMVEKGLHKGIKDGYVRKDIEPKILARLRMEEIEMGFNQSVFPADKFKIIDVHLAMAEHFLYGICTLKGHKLINKRKRMVEE